MRALIYLLLVGIITGLIGWINQTYIEGQVIWYWTMRPYKARSILGKSIMTTALFMDGEASDLGYCNIRDAKRGSEESARYHCEYLWIFFQHHADQNFREAKTKYT